MLPPPPDLADAAVKWNDRELFWIVKHGIKYTGMPAWVSQHRDDEVWAVVAFLKRLPALDARGYQTLALGGLQVAAQSGRELATTEGAAEAVSACARCHGAEGRRPASKFVPVLHGQPRAFLAAALEAYASDKRASGMMQPVASDLASDAVQKVAAFYAGLPPPPPDQTAADPQAVTRGQTLARDGRPGARIPECLSCHGEGALQTYPRLAGQNAAYVAGRLHRWKRGIAAATDTEAIMAPIAQLLSDQEIQDLSAYFASLRPRAK
jgi:cytochrome c553